MKIHRLFIKTHRILGICLSILFLMWFVSGIVMMYHTYPRVEKEQALAFAEDIDTVLLPIQNLVEELPLRDPVKSISLNKRAGENVIRISTEEEEFLLNARTGLPIGKFSSGQLQQIANRWSSGDAMLKDTLNEIDVWLIGAYPFKDFPVYHYCFPDEEKGELYLSSRTGDALQFTTWKSRFWAWVGAIPHWIYVKQFRAHGRQPWKDIMGFRNRYFDDAFRNLCRYPFFSDSPEKASHRNSIPEKAVPVASSGRPLFRIVHLDVDIQRVYVVGSSAAMDIESPRATQCPG